LHFLTVVAVRRDHCRIIVPIVSMAFGSEPG
jgi:hypothetical protein